MIEIIDAIQWDCGCVAKIIKELKNTYEVENIEICSRHSFSKFKIIDKRLLESVSKALFKGKKIIIFADEIL